ncbi:histone-lysine n-methyltransferase atxr3 [Hordeum vulgare]|nr:histone-lysine n-methyltransferase atxr3 [Hordeum vulgare]
MAVTKSAPTEPWLGGDGGNQIYCCWRWWMTVTATVSPEAPVAARIDPARAFNINVRMETCTLTAAGTKGEETGFTFPIVVDNSSTFEYFRETILAKYPWGLYDAVELRNHVMQSRNHYYSEA